MIPDTKPPGPFGLPFEVAEQIRDCLRRGEQDFAAIAQRAGVSFEIVWRINKRWRNRERLARKREEHRRC
jgi:hypothetical protein